MTTFLGRSCLRLASRGASGRPGRSRRYAALLALASLAALPAGAAMGAAGAAVGQPAPAIEMVDTRGREVSLDSLAGKVVVLEWLNFECPYTRKHYDSGNMQALQRQVHEAGGHWISIISSAPGEQGHLSPEEADRLMTAAGGAPSAILLDEDGAVGRAYGAKTTPHMFVIAADGDLAYMGGIDSIASARPEDVPKAEPWLRDAFVAVSRGEAPLRSISRPYGCSVKYAR